MIAFWISAAGLAIGAGMGLYAMINPRWAAKLVRLRDDPERPGGFAEFRGTYGGLFFASHAYALWLLTQKWKGIGDYRDGAVAAGFNPVIHNIASEMVAPALLVCASMWWGTAIGRVLSMLFDKMFTRYNLASVGFELGLGALILVPPILPIITQ